MKIKKWDQFILEWYSAQGGFNGNKELDDKEDEDAKRSIKEKYPEVDHREIATHVGHRYWGGVQDFVKKHKMKRGDMELFRKAYNIKPDDMINFRASFIEED